TFLVSRLIATTSKRFIDLRLAIYFLIPRSAAVTTHIPLFLLLSPEIFPSPMGMAVGAIHGHGKSLAIQMRFVNVEKATIRTSDIATEPSRSHIDSLNACS